MTFEDFIEKERPWSQNLHQIEQYKLVWNAAIKACITTLESGDYYWPSVNNTGPDRQPNRASFAEDELKKLLTSK